MQPCSQVLRVVKITLLSILMVGIISTVAIANITSPQTSGDFVGEPTGSLRSLAIIRELLSFDLRPIDQVGLARIVVTYQVRNQGQPKSVDLVFISPGIKAGSVTVDRASVPSTTLKLLNLPPQWQPPKTVPGISELPFPQQPKNKYKVNNTLASGLRFTATLPQGEHQLQVSYDMHPSTSDDALYRDYQIAYILAPARSWANFGVLEVSVNLPTKWKVATSLPMKRTGDTLRAIFKGLPADSLAITTRPPLHPLTRGGIILLPATGVIIGLISSWWLGEVAGRKVSQLGWGKGKVFLLAVGMMPLGGSVFAVLALIGERLAWSLLANGHISHSWSSKYEIATSLLLILGFCVSSLIMLKALRSSGRSLKSTVAR